jgi:DNA polymerase I-like protein with 3'-5' exonuclease and polymerase domains
VQGEAPLGAPIAPEHDAELAAMSSEAEARFTAMAQNAAGFLTAPVSVEDAYRYKEAYLTAYPEMRDYFDYINWLVQSGTPLTQFVSNRVRGGVEYTSGANSFFQGLAADLAKRAVFQISRDMYCDPSSPLWGSRIVAFIHDEIVAEVPKDRAHEAAMEIERMMCAAFSEVCPDVPPAAEAALMTRWVKAAAPRHDARGRLIPWDL